MAADWQFSPSSQSFEASLQPSRNRHCRCDEDTYCDPRVKLWHFSQYPDIRYDDAN